jgi:hypothetical protein
MNVSDLTDTEHTAIKKALAYWVEHWDWECPTLFGLELNEVRDVLETWPSNSNAGENMLALAVGGALRELLHGASAIRKERIPEVCGLSYDSMAKLQQRLSEGVANGSR